MRRIERVRTVLDQEQVVLSAELHDRRQVRLRQPEVVRHQNCSRSRVDRLPEIVEVDSGRSVDTIEASRRGRLEDGVELRAAVVGRDEDDVGLLHA